MPDGGGEKPAAAPRSRRPAVARSAARLGAVQALYQMDIGGTDMIEVLAQYGSGRLGDDFNEGQCGEADAGFLKSIVEGVVADQALIDRKVITDFRAPDTIRLGLSPLYTTFTELWDAVEAIADVVESETYRDFPAEPEGVT